jgi:predicted TIM-barrel fold metal-dependent hydrolase
MAVRVDSHAHVFHPNLPFITPRRYTPAYDATADALLANLDASSLQMVLLTQPSFLGTDNSHMLDAVARSPERLRAVVVVDETVS